MRVFRERIVEVEWRGKGRRCFDHRAISVWEGGGDNDEDVEDVEDVEAAA